VNAQHSFFGDSANDNGTNINPDAMPCEATLEVSRRRVAER
jgi:hypothetical protein